MAGDLRIHFTSEDLAKLRLATAPDPLWELVLSAYSLRDPGPALDVVAWRGQARRELASRPLSGGERMLAELTRPGAFPDFLTPLAALDGFDAGLDAVRSTPDHQLREEIAHIGTQRALPAWARDLGDHMSALTDGLRTYFDAVIQPHWRTVRARCWRPRTWSTGRSTWTAGACC
ncbi:hypothetical protein [Lentzea tibetensis]|uniref:hypothetical protein n=1 Tax=Lentzea tibetensis TaxID=2591470 RepID=UPI001C9A00D2|nr:hypothetical protein [Lentzea tibetensis]